LVASYRWSFIGQQQFDNEHPIRANDAVFDAKPHAPQQLIDAVGIIEDDLFRVQNWRGLLNKNRLLLEDAVGFKAGKDVL
jgi:hypothetical protein